MAQKFMRKKRRDAHGSVYGLVALSLSLVLMTVTKPAEALSLDEAMAHAYQSNPALNSARANSRSTSEYVPQAKATWWRPQVSASYQQGTEYLSQFTEGAAKDINQSVDSKVAKLNVTFPLYRGGQTSAAIERAQNMVSSSNASLLATEQSVLRSAVDAYTSVSVAMATVSAAQKRLKDLETARVTSKRLLDEQRGTILELYRARSNVADAQADLSIAQAQLIAVQEAFFEITGMKPISLEHSPELPSVPETLTDLELLVEDNNPDILSAEANVRAAEKAVRGAKGALLPQVGLVGSATKTLSDTHMNSPSSGNLRGRSTDIYVGVSVTMPLYDGASSYSLVRQETQNLSRARFDLIQARNTAFRNARQYWSDRKVALERLKAKIIHRDTLQLVSDQIGKEFSEGRARIQDVLDAHDQLFVAETDLLAARKSILISSARILEAAGSMTADHLDLSVEIYNPNDYAKSVENRLFGYQ